MAISVYDLHPTPTCLADESVTQTVKSLCLDANERFTFFFSVSRLSEKVVIHLIRAFFFISQNVKFLFYYFIFALNTESMKYLAQFVFLNAF